MLRGLFEAERLAEALRARLRAQHEPLVEQRAVVLEQLCDRGRVVAVAELNRAARLGDDGALPGIDQAERDVVSGGEMDLAFRALCLDGVDTPPGRADVEDQIG